MHNHAMGQTTRTMPRLAPDKAGWRSRLRLAVAGLLGLLLLPAVATAQRVPQRRVEKAIDFTTGQGDNLFSVLRSQDHIHAFEEGLAAIEAGEPRAGVEQLHRLLLAENGGVVPVAPGRFLGLRLAVITAMANLSPAAKAAYEDLVQREGGAVTAVDTLSPETLTLLAERFPTAAIGLRARLRLGDLALTAGDGRLAASHFRNALDATAIGSSDERRVADRLRCADVLIDPATARADRAREPLATGNDDVLAVLPVAAESGNWPSLGGGGSGRTPMPAIAGQPDQRWSEEILAPGFDEREISHFPMYVVGDLGGLFVNTGQEVVAVDPLRKGISWVSVSPMREYGQTGLQAQRGRRGGDDGINEDMVLAAACSDDMVVAALQVPEKSMNVDFNGGYRVMSKIPMRRLYAFDRTSGKVRWSHYDELDGPRTRRFRGHDACANPVIVGDTVYVPIHDRSGAIAFSIAAYDLHTGALRWRRLVCSSQQDVNMFGNARAEFAASPLCLQDGVLFGASNLGVAYAVEAATGRLRWLSAYEVVRMPRTMIHQQQDRQVFFANNSPVAADGVVCMTPLDSQFVLGFDAESGRVLWRVDSQASVGPTDNRLTWLAGALGDEFVLTGTGAIAVKARPANGERATMRQLVAPGALGDRRNSLLAPRPAVTADAVWFPRADRLYGFARDGQPVAGSPLTLGRFLPGNLLLVGGIAVAVRQHVLEVAYDANALLTRVAAEAKASPGDPALLLRLASLRRALLPENAEPAALADVRQLYQQGLDAAVQRGLPKHHPVRLALQRELYEQALGLAEAALRTGAPGALELLAQARDSAPDETQWLQVQALVLARCSDDRARFTAELDRLLATAPDGIYPLGEGVPVRAWVAWQRARHAGDPATAVARWQELLENHGAQPLAGTAAAKLAREAIDALIQQHGDGCYAAVRQRAEAALAAAGADRGALADLAERFPNSAAATQARVRLVDAAVRAGDLAVVCSVLSQALAAGQVPPGIARRVVLAAHQRGNHALGQALAERLRPHGQLVSDWPDDRGRTYAQVLADLTTPTANPAARLLLPSHDVATIKPRSPSEFPSLVPLLPAAGFDAVADTPLYVKAERELLAIDIHSAAETKPVLFAVPIDFLEHAILCGTTLIVPDMDRVFALDYRTGEKRWELPNGRRRLLESLGVQQGVLHVTALPRTADGEGEFLGIEPLSGSLLFAHTLAAGVLKPKAIEGALLRMAVAADGGATIERLDPVSGEPVATTRIAGPVLQAHIQLEPDSLSTRFYPQSLCSDGQLLFLPVDSSLSGDAPRVVAIAADGSVAWQWRGENGGNLPIAALHGDRLVVLESSDRRPGRLLLLRARDGEVLRQVDAGHDAAVLNWERSWLASPAPAMLAVESFADADRTERQLVCFAVADDGPTFVLPLGKEDGEILHAPQFGPDFVTFGTRPLKGAGNRRLWLVSLRDRSGLLPDGRKYRLLADPGGADTMTSAAGHVVLSGAQGILLLGTERGK